MHTYKELIIQHNLLTHLSKLKAKIQCHKNINQHWQEAIQPLIQPGSMAQPSPLAKMI